MVLSVCAGQSLISDRNGRMSNIYVLVICVVVVITHGHLSLAANQYETEPNDTMETADPVTETGADFIYGQFLAETDEDWFAISIVEAGLINVSIHSTAYTQNFSKTILNGNGVVLGSNYSDTLTVYLPEGGTYYLLITDSDWDTTHWADELYAITISGEGLEDSCTGCGGFTQEDLDASYDQGYSDGVNVSGTMYTQEQMDQMVSDILAWGDTDGDGKIGLQEAVNALQVTVGNQ